LERELRDARDFLGSVLQSSVGLSIIALDLDRRAGLWNEGAQRNHGYTSAEIMGRSIDELHAPEDLASGVAQSPYAAALDRGNAEALLPLRGNDGSELIAETMVRRRIGPRGQKTGYLLLARNVSLERQQADRERLLAEAGAILT